MWWRNESADAAPQVQGDGETHLSPDKQSEEKKRHERFIQAEIVVNLWKDFKIQNSITW